MRRLKLRSWATLVALVALLIWQVYVARTMRPAAHEPLGTQVLIQLGVQHEAPGTAPVESRRQ